MLFGAVAAGLVAVVAIVGVVWDGGGDGAPAPTGSQGPRSDAESSPPAAAGGPERSAPATTPQPAGVTVSMEAEAEVWVCLLDADGKPLVEGVVLPAGSTEGPFRSESFTLSLGNGEVAMRIDGEPAEIPESSSPLGYEIGPDGGLSPLSEAERPTCL